MKSSANTKVDPREVEYYGKLAETWWDEGGPFWPLHRLNELRTVFIRDTLCESLGRDIDEPEPLGGLAVLDVGCGGGILSEAMARLGAEVHGIDVVAKNIAVAHHHASKSGLSIRYETLTSESLRQTGAAYDVVLNMEVVEHVPDVPALLNDCAAMVKPGGLLIVATINRTILAYLFAIVGAEYVLRWLPRGTHRWRQFPKPREIEDILRANGLTRVARTGVKINPLNRHFSLTPLMAVNYMLVASRPNEDEPSGK